MLAKNVVSINGGCGRATASMTIHRSNGNQNSLPEVGVVVPKAVEAAIGS